MASLLAIQPGTTVPSIFCFHAFGGSVAPYGELVVRVGRQYPAFGLQAVGLIDGGRPDRSVLTMAQRYAAEIAAAPPAGPVVFLGYSLGGLLAVEVARLIGKLFDQDPLVVAIDSDPEYRSTGPEDGWSILVHQVLSLRRPLPGLAALPPAEALERVRAAAAAERKLPPRFNLDRLARMAEVCRINEQAAAEYRPQPYSGRVVSLRSVPPDAAGPADAADRWAPHVAHLEVGQIPGDHHSIMTAAGYPRLASRIRDLLPAPN